MDEDNHKILLAWKRVNTPEFDALSLQINEKLWELGEAASTDTDELEESISKAYFAAFKAGYIAGTRKKV